MRLIAINRLTALNQICCNLPAYKPENSDNGGYGASNKVYDIHK